MIDPISWSFSWPYILTAFAFGYLCGSIPFGLLIPKLAGLGDVRNIGSGNIGATNVLRTGNKAVAFCTLLADVLKGTIPVLVASQWGPDMTIVAALGAFLGHVLPIWLKFKGGKGVATFIGVQLGLYWPVALIFMAVWLMVALLFRFSSLSALVASVVAPIAAAMLHEWQIAELLTLMTVIIFFTHRANIGRLFKGEEARIGAKD